MSGEKFSSRADARAASGPYRRQHGQETSQVRASWVRAVGPVLPIAVCGAVWIALHATAGRGGTHTLFQVLALADLDAIMILPVLLAVATVADRRGRRTATVAALMTAAVVAAMPFLHGDQVSVLTGMLPRLAAVAMAAGLGAWVRASPSRDPGRCRAGPGGCHGLSRARARPSAEGWAWAAAGVRHARRGAVFSG